MSRESSGRERWISSERMRRRLDVCVGFALIVKGRCQSREAGNEEMCLS
jgi:hypothetical protein